MPTSSDGPSTVRMSHLSGRDARTALAASPVVLIPMGSHEDQGPHAPMGDYLLADRIAELGAQRATQEGTPTVVAPVIPFGAEDYFRSMPGGIVLEPATFSALLRDVITSLADDGLTRIVIVNGHRGNVAPIEETARFFQRHRDLQIPTLHIWELAYKTLAQVVGEESARERASHGADPLASVALHLVPELVKREHMPEQQPTSVDPVLGLDVVRLGILDMNGANVALPCDYSHVFHDGVGNGSPRLADAETGHVIADRLIGAVAELAGLVAAKLGEVTNPAPRVERAMTATANEGTGIRPTDRVLDEVAAQLDQARLTTTVCDPVRARIGANDIEAAYAVQRRITQARLARGDKIVGRKIGLTSPTVQAQLGVDRPDFGVLFADMQIDDGADVNLDPLIQPKVEAEVAFILDKDLADGPLDKNHVRGAVGAVHASLEVVDSRIKDWDITFGDTVADNASSALFVLGEEGLSIEDIEPVAVEMRLLRNGEVESFGNGAACLGDPLEALSWLARTLVEVGDPLRAGDVVLSGALGPMISISPGDEIVATMTGLGMVKASFSSHRSGTHKDESRFTTEGTQ